MGISWVNGRLWGFWPPDSRNYAFASRPLAGRVYAGSLTLPGKGAEPQLSAYRPAQEPAPPVHATEARDVAGIRAHRVTAGNESLRIVRGDLHRHTELSHDIGGLDDGSGAGISSVMVGRAGEDV